MSLFQKTIVSKYLKTQNQENIHLKWETFKEHFHNSEIQNNIRNSKEEEYQEGFLRDLFVTVLGYTLKPQINHNLYRELKNVNDSKKADGGIIVNDIVTAVIELKGTDTTDLGKVESQAFGYKNNQSGCKYVITSNFEKLRFYIDNAIEFLEFNLFELTKEEFELLYLCLAYENIAADIPSKLKNESLSKEDEITKNLYKDYSVFKRELFQNLTQQNPDFNPLELFKKSQKLLDRLLFLFFGEDRGLLPVNFTRGILNDWQKLKELDAYIPLYDRFKQNFGYIDQGGKKDVFAYNGGLFKPDEILDNITIDDDLLYSHTYKLAEYDFASEVDVNILGHIFENSLNEIDEIKAQLEGQEIDKTKTKRKKDGVFYTPKYITKYIVENTVGKLCEEKKTEIGIVEEEYFTDKKRQQKTKLALLQKLENYRKWLHQITIIDPACGSGAFLNEALNFLIKEHKYIDELDSKLDKKYGTYGLEFNIKNSILENNLFGVDLNEESVEIAKLSLWLRTAEPNRKLNDLSNNIKCGNSLIDDPEFAGNKAFNWEKEFPLIFAKGGFDVVIGNPPYVRQELLAKKDKEFFVTKYSTGNGTADLYVYFYEKAINILQKNGILGFITPNKFYKTKYGKELRQYLIKYKIIELVDFFELKVFEDASTDSQILILEKNNTSCSFNYSPIKNIADFKDNLYSRIEIDPQNLSDEIWVFNNSNDLNILNKMKETSISLDDYTKNGIFRGITTGLNEAFIINEEIKNKIIAEDPKSSELIKPYVTGTEIEKFNLNIRNKYYLLHIKWEFNPKEYPGIFKYLEKHKLKLEIRPEVKEKRYNWYAMSRYASDYFHLFELPKIIYIHTAVHHKFYYDEEGYYINNSCYLISNADKFLSVWLNSKIFSFYKKLNFVAYGDSSESGRAKLDYNKMINVPIPNISENKKQPFIEKADEMLSLNKEMQEISEKFQRTLQREIFTPKLPEALPQNNLSKKLQNWYELSFADFLKELSKSKGSRPLGLSEKAEWEDYFLQEQQKAISIKSKIEQTDAAIDQMVYELYGLTEEEIEIVENS